MFILLTCARQFCFQAYFLRRLARRHHRSVRRGKNENWDLAFFFSPPGFTLCPPAGETRTLSPRCAGMSERKSGMYSAVSDQAVWGHCVCWCAHVLATTCDGVHLLRIFVRLCAITYVRVFKALNARWSSQRDIMTHCPTRTKSETFVARSHFSNRFL